MELGPRQLAEIRIRSCKKCQGTTSVVPQPQKNQQGLSPCGPLIRPRPRPLSATCRARSKTGESPPLVTFSLRYIPVKPLRVA